MAEDDQSSLQNFHDDIGEYYDDGPCDGDVDYECLDDEENISAIKESNEYIKNICDSSGLHIIEKARAIQAYEREGVLGLLYLFLASSYLKDCIFKWTKDVYKEKFDAKTFTWPLFKGYIGLEIAMSFNTFNSISDYWSTKMFSGNKDFKDVMGRDTFKWIRGCLTLHHPFATADFHQRSAADPLYHSRTFLNRFITRITQVAVPYGASAFDEASMSTKARTRSRTYMPNKPSKYGIIFYSFVSHAFSYLFSFFDNGSGNF